MTFDFKTIGAALAALTTAFVAVGGTHWAVSAYVDGAVESYLIEQTTRAHQRSDETFHSILEQLQDLEMAAGDLCGVEHRRALLHTTLQSANITVTIAYDADGRVACQVPDLGNAQLVGFREPVQLFTGDAELSQVRVDETRLTGLLFDIDSGGMRYQGFVPRQMFPHFFDGVDESVGVVLTLGETVLFARNAAIDPDGRTSDIEVRSTPLSVGPLRTQVSVNRALLAGSYEALQRWTTIISSVIALLLATLFWRLTKHTPKQVDQIERAIENNEFVPFYQPVFDVENGQLVGCEVLVRWVKPDGRIIAPGSFIGLAEQSGLAVPMTRKLMQAVVADLKTSYAGRRRLKVAINLFNQHFDNLDIIHDVEEIFGPSPIAYSQVVLEITERAPLESLSRAKVIMRKLQRMGCRLALDDAGTGHGGLAYLQELGLDIVKIDKMFIDQLGKSRVGESITQSLTELATQLDMDVVAEGVENIDQVDHLKRFGIRQAQGYLFAPPLPAARYLALVAKMSVADTKRSEEDEGDEALERVASIHAAAEQLIPVANEEAA
ncbi:MAG: EAL domain-containing protein [Pseudomonadota bacterium]